MTNAEKFKEVFGVDPDIDELVLSCPLDPRKCKWNDDGVCKCNEWWAEEYQLNE